MLRSSKCLPWLRCRLDIIKGYRVRRDPVVGPDILEPIEILGVDKFADSAVIIKARTKTLPVKQWGVAREFNRRLKMAFDERNIEMPFPHVTLYAGVDKNPTS